MRNGHIENAYVPNFGMFDNLGGTERDLTDLELAFLTQLSRELPALDVWLHNDDDGTHGQSFRTISVAIGELKRHCASTSTATQLPVAGVRLR